MKFKIFAAPGDHRDDFGSLETQLNEWAQAEKPEIVTMQSSVTSMTEKNTGRYLLSVVVAYRPGQG